MITAKLKMAKNQVLLISNQLFSVAILLHQYQRDFLRFVSYEASLLSGLSPSSNCNHQFLSINQRLIACIQRLKFRRCFRVLRLFSKRLSFFIESDKAALNLLKSLFHDLDLQFVNRVKIELSKIPHWIT